MLLVLAGGRGRTEGEPLDPRSTEELGARGLVVLLEESGVDVDVTSQVPGDEGGVVVVLRDQLSRVRRAQLREWVGRGGTAVVVDPLSDLAPAIEQRVGSIFEELEGDEEASVGSRPACPLPVLEAVDRIEAPGLVPYRVPAGSVGCFPVGRGRAVVFSPVGQGTIVAVGGGAPFVNTYLDDADNAVLALSLMAPQRAGARTVVLERTEAGGGDDDLSDLVGRGIKLAIVQLLVAFGLLALARSRRVGAPVVEAQPADIEGSELVTAVGRLLEAGGKRDQAAAMLRRQLRRALAERAGVPLDASPTVAIDAATALGLPHDRVAAVLADRGLPSDEELVALASEVAALRSELIHAR